MCSLGRICEDKQTNKQTQPQSVSSRMSQTSAPERANSQAGEGGTRRIVILSLHALDQISDPAQRDVRPVAFGDDAHHTGQCHTCC